MRATSAALMLAFALQTLPAGAQMQGGAELPDMGSPADTVLTREQERAIALSVIEQFRSAGRLVTDPEINEYVANLAGGWPTGRRTATTSSTFSSSRPNPSTRSRCRGATSACTRA